MYGGFCSHLLVCHHLFAVTDFQTTNCVLLKVQMETVVSYFKILFYDLTREII